MQKEAQPLLYVLPPFQSLCFPAPTEKPTLYIPLIGRLYHPANSVLENDLPIVKADALITDLVSQANS